MPTDRKWRENPGKAEKARDPKAMRWLRFRNGYESPEPRQAGTYNWSHRGWDFDIMASAPADD